MASRGVQGLSAPDSMMVNVWFQSQQTPYQVQRHSTMGQLRQRVAAAYHVPAAEMKFLLGGSQLKDSLTIEASGVGMESTLFAIHRPYPLPQPSTTTTPPPPPSSTTPPPSLPPPLQSTPPATTTPAGEGVMMSSVDPIARRPVPGRRDGNPAPSVASVVHSEECGCLMSDQYYVYCKVCGQVKPGRLRVQCSQCQGGAVLLDRDPGSWEDVLIGGRVTGSCQTLHCERCQPVFYFKCVEHHASGGGDSSRAVALRHILPNRRCVPCITCQDVMSPVVVFPCQWSHVMCLGCFLTYCSVRLKERAFQHTPQYGYTLPCPAGCEASWLQEQHHFCVLGGELYERYKDFAAEECLLAEGGVFCPQTHCASGFLLESAADARVTCPHCKFVFCRHCRKAGHDGACDSTPTPHPQDFSDADRAARAVWERQTADTIQQTTKACPGCRTRTERDGGCMHMRCRCGEEWCWLCVKTWDRDCQGAHWFG